MLEDETFVALCVLRALQTSKSGRDFIQCHGIPNLSGLNPELYVTLTNEMTLPPGVINQVRRLRWNIEKAFNQQERKLDESKAWTANEIGKRIQAIAICITHNLLRLFGAKIEREEGIVDTKVIKAWHQRLDARADAAVKAGRELPLKLYESLYRPTEVSLQFIRWHAPRCSNRPATERL